MKPQNRINKPAGTHDLLLSTAILLGLLAIAVIFWFYPFITAGAFVIFIASMSVARSCGHLHFFHRLSPARHLSVDLH